MSTCQFCHQPIRSNEMGKPKNLEFALKVAKQYGGEA
jgi:hypothetical protein